MKEYKRHLVMALLLVMGACGGEVSDPQNGEEANPKADAGAQNTQDAGSQQNDPSDGGEVISCSPGEQIDTRMVAGGAGCTLGQRQEALTCNSGGDGYQWQALDEFDGTQRECEPGTMLLSGDGCRAEKRVCMESDCTLGPLEPARECEPEQVVFVNFDGETIDDCPGSCEDPQDNTSWIVGDPYGGEADSWEFLPFSRDRAAKDEILNKLSTYYARFLIQFVDVRPDFGNYTMVMVTDTHLLPNHGVCRLDCINSTEQICLVNNITDNTNDTISRFTAHELGHSFGLHHVDSAGDIMAWDSSGSAFTQAALDTEQACGLTMGQIQDAPAILGGNLGLRDEENVGASCYADGDRGACINTDVTTCNGVVHVGACPGPAAIRCCVP